MPADAHQATPQECGECGRNGEDFAACPRPADVCPTKPTPQTTPENLDGLTAAEWREEYFRRHRDVQKVLARAIIAEAALRDLMVPIESGTIIDGVAGRAFRESRQAAAARELLANAR